MPPAFPVLLYVAVMATFATPLYEPLVSGRDDSWALAVVVGAAHVAVGLAVRRAWVLVLPVVLSVVAFFVDGAEGLSWLVLIFGTPALVAVTVVGWLLGRPLGARADPVAAVLVLVALVPAGWAAVEWARRGPHLAPSVQARLPTMVSLGSCHPDLPPGDSRDTRRRAEALIHELRRQPDALVTKTYYYSDEPEERRDITVRELAEEQLRDLEANGCTPALGRRIRGAME